MVPVFILFAIAVFQFQSMMKAGMRAITKSNYEARLKAVSKNAQMGSSPATVTGEASERAGLLLGWKSLFEPYSTINARTYMLAGTRKRSSGHVEGVLSGRSRIFFSTYEQ